MARLALATGLTGAALVAAWRQQTAPEVAVEEDVGRVARTDFSSGANRRVNDDAQSASTPPASPPVSIFAEGFNNGGFGGFHPIRPHGPIFRDGFEGAPAWSHVVGGDITPVPPPPLDIVSETTHLLPDRWRTVVYVVPRRPAQRLAILRADGSRWEQPYPAIRETWWLDQAGTLPCPCVVEVDEGARTWRAPLAVEAW